MFNPASSFNYDNSLDSLIKKSYSDPNPKQDDPPFLFNFPSPFLDEHESPLNQIFFQNSSHQMPHQISHDPPVKDAARRGAKLSESREIPLRRRSLGVVPRRRTGKKDRHSKICTAQGVRDRRMRLSLQVARKFFDLQDMLGYDKASKTIEWLFTKSKKAIKELIDDLTQTNNISNNSTDVKSESFNLSECEVVSGIEENTSKAISTTPPTKDERKIASKSNARESRERARERARSRTREKMMAKCLENPGQWYKVINPNEHVEHKLGCFEVGTVDQESNQENVESDHYSSFQHHPLGDVGTIEKFLGNSSSSTATSWPTSENSSAAVSAYTDPNISFMGFYGNWEFLNMNERISSSIFSDTNPVSLAGNNPNSVYSTTAEFP